MFATILAKIRCSEYNRNTVYKKYIISVNKREKQYVRYKISKESSGYCETKSQK